MLWILKLLWNLQSIWKLPAVQKALVYRTVGHGGGGVRERSPILLESWISGLRVDFKVGTVYLEKEKASQRNKEDVLEEVLCELGSGGIRI